MAEMPTMTVTVEGLEMIPAIVQLKTQNDELLAALTYVQSVSTQQVERIRALEAQVQKREIVLLAMPREENHVG